MNLSTLFRNVSTVLLSLVFIFSPTLIARAQDTAVKQAQQTTKSAAQQAGKATSAAANSAKPSQADIDAAKASGKVWVNTDSGVYHKSGKYFGNTKHGKFMTEQEATSAGYHAAKNEKQQ